MIICCGEALIDMLPRRLDGDDVFLPAPGGAIFNTAIGLGRLGEDVGFLSGISTDMFGEQLIAALRASNVDVDLALRSDRPTTLAFVKLTDGQARYTFLDENSAGRMIDESDLPDLPAAASALHFGAVSLIAEPCGAAYEALMMRHADDRLISLDPNVRPSFVADEPSYRARMDRMLGRADIIKVSDEDLDWLSDEPADDWARQRLEDGASVVTITRGGDGAVIHTRDSTLERTPPKVTVADTIGAGDTFNAGFLAGLARSGLLDKEALSAASSDAIAPALELALAVAAVTVSRVGADPPWQSELG